MKVLYVHCALYLPLVYAKELRKRGIEAEVLYLCNPELRWIVGEPDYNFSPDSLRKLRNIIRFLVFFLEKVGSFDVVHFHSAPGFVPFSMFGRLNALLGTPDIRFLRLKRIKIIYSHWGCYDGRLPSTFIKENDGKICKNCKTGVFGAQCTDKRTQFTCMSQEKFADHILNHEPDFKDFNRYAEYHPAIVDFDIFNREIEIPERYRLEKYPDYFYVYHSVGQGKRRGNERGTHVIVKVIEDMNKKGYKIKLISTNGTVPYQYIGFYQRQADLAIDNLYYNWYGNMVRECMAQAVPVATHLEQSWIDNHVKFYKEFPPIINVDEKNLRKILEYYIVNPQELKIIGIRQQEYVRNVHGTEQLIDRLLKIYRS